MFKVRDEDLAGMLASQRNRIEELEEAVTACKQEIKELNKKVVVHVPVVDENDRALPELVPQAGTWLTIGPIGRLHEERTLADVVAWLEEALECKFKIVRQKDQEGAWER